MNSFRYRLKTLIFSPNMLISILIGVTILLWNHIGVWINYNINVGPLSLKNMGSIFLNDIYKAHNFSGFGLFAPFLAVLPAATIFCDDYNSGYIIPVIGRTGYKRYIAESISCVSISGGLAVFIPCFITYTFYLLNGKLNTYEKYV